MPLLRRLVAAAFLATLGTALLAMAFAEPALADLPRNWQMGMQPAASPVQRDIHSLHNLVLVIITVITIFVGALLAYVIWRFSADKNPNPSQTSHNTVLEVAWTVIPVLILVVIAIPSFRLVYFQDRTQEADMTVKVTGRQWYWEYTYADAEGLNFGSRPLDAKGTKWQQGIRLLDVDEPLVLPVGKNIRILSTSADVIHSFFVPALGVQRHPRPHHRDLGAHRPPRHLLRPVQPDLRRGPLEHADRRARPAGSRIHRLAGGGEEEVRHQ